ncbi:unnamed protein product [Prunus brigantina]
MSIELKYYYNKRAKVRQFQLGNLVLRKAFITVQNTRIKEDENRLGRPLHDQPVWGQRKLHT